MSALPDRVEDLLDSVDAAVFSGDSFHSDAGRERFQWYLDRWQRAMKIQAAQSNDAGEG